MILDQQTLWVIGISIIIFLISEIFLRSTEKLSEYSSRQKHVWSIFLFIFSVSQGVLIVGLYEIKSSIVEISRIYETTNDSGFDDKMDSLYVSYYQSMSSPDLKGWVIRDLGSLNNLLSHQQVKLHKDEMRQMLTKSYGTAKSYIVATNVGSVDFYFGTDAAAVDYRTANTKCLTENRVPVIRFYIYTGEEREDSLKAFWDRVVRCHEGMSTVYSVLIQSKNLKNVEIHDYLLKDNEFLTETKFAGNGEPIGGIASQNKEDLTEARDFFKTLSNLADKTEYKEGLGMEEIKKHLHKYKNDTSQTLAQNIFKEIMNDVTNGN